MILGHRDQRRLWIDLVFAPDVLTITGHPAASLRQAVALIRQLHASETSLTVVGRALRPWLPDGCPRFDTLTDALATQPAPGAAGPEVVVCVGLSRKTLRTAHQQLNGGERRIIPIIVGDVPTSRWSMCMTEAGSADA